MELTLTADHEQALQSAKLAEEHDVLFVFLRNGSPRITKAEHAIWDLHEARRLVAVGGEGALIVLTRNQLRLLGRRILPLLRAYEVALDSDYPRRIREAARALARYVASRGLNPRHHLVLSTGIVYADYDAASPRDRAQMRRDNAVWLGSW